MNPRVVVFDFDGVLIESVAIKSRAFRDLFAEHPEHHEAIERHHLEHLGISRYEKFAWIHRELLGREIGPAESAELGRRYSEIVFARARDCAAVTGAQQTLDRLREEDRLLYIASGTPENELRRIVEERGWAGYFRGVYGSPRAKPAILGEILQHHEAEPEDLVMIGDGWSDYQAAHATGVGFVLRETAEQESYFRDYDGPRIADMVGLPEILGLGEARQPERE